MNFRIVLVLVAAGFVVFCGWLVLDSGLCQTCRPGAGPCVLLQQTTITEGKESGNASPAKKQTLEAADLISFGADHAPATSVKLGSTDPKSNFMFQMELSSKGAAISSAIFSKFKDRDPKDPQPLEILSPVQLRDGREVLSMANTSFIFVKDELYLLRLDELHWENLGIEKGADGSQTTSFKAVIENKNTGEPLIKLTKTYKITPGSYLMNCDVTVENLTENEQKVRFNLGGPTGLGREGFRSDMRQVIAGFREKEEAGGNVVSDGLNTKKLRNAKEVADRRPAKPGTDFLWIAAVNKYFAAIVVPVPDENKKFCDWLADKTGRFYNPDGDESSKSGDETIGLDLKIASRILAKAGEVDSKNTYKFQLYLGPKDKSLFDKKELLLFSTGLEFQTDLDNGTISKSVRQVFKNNGIQLSGNAGISIEEKGNSWLITDNRETYSISKGQRNLNIYHRLYHRLGFAHTITFMPCFCCPTCIIHPIAFAILWLMKWMHTYIIGNYGVVIMILVFLFRFAMHPVTKKSQISMRKMTKLGPKAEEIKKKYANNKAEMNKQLMALYKEQGLPIMGFLPMMVQMPIWISLWSAVYASVELRGAAFLPFWITDLSMPDALIRFSTITVPLIGWKIESLNLLPLMMGLAFYLQQKLMPHQSGTPANPQLAQQQKMMMIMFPLMFPLMLYKAPSGVNLYIMSSTFAGVIEQYFIRKHIREKEEAESKGLVAATSKTGGKTKKKKPKPFYKI
jgi:YidC/Oxa1 family membrane protein insertase